MDYVSPSRPFTRTSIRILRELKNNLKHEADNREMSLNSLINSILERHILFDRILEHVNAMPLNGPLFTGMLESVPVERMEELGRNLGPKLIKETFAFLGLNYDLENLIKSYFEPLSLYSGWYRFNVSGSDRDRRLLFEHQHGFKWSIFLKQYISGIIKATMGTEPRVMVEEGLIIVYC
jgi:hypothetical protein